VRYCLTAGRRRIPSIYSLPASKSLAKTLNSAASAMPTGVCPPKHDGRFTNGHSVGTTAHLSGGLAMEQIILAVLFFAGGLVACADDAAPPATESKAATNDPDLRRDLLDRTRKDQTARKALIDWSKEHGSNGNVDMDRLNTEKKGEYEQLIAATRKIDSENTQWLKDIVDKHGWPTKSMVHDDGANAAWLLVQHADADVKFQRKCLDLMAALPKGEVFQTNFAYLTDRVLLAEGKRQLYGTQFTMADGKLQPSPLEDEANVDKLRADVGLPSLAEYAKVLEETYGSGSKK
jgi:hypothetical protein